MSSDHHPSDTPSDPPSDPHRNGFPLLPSTTVLAEAPGAAAPAHKPLLTPALLWYGVTRWWKVALPVGLLLASLVAAGIWYLFQPTYVSQAWLRIRRQRPMIVTTLPGEEEREFVATQVELIKSPIVCNRILADPDVANLPEVRDAANATSWIKGRLNVRAMGRSELFQIEFRGPQPTGAAKILDAVVGAYVALYDQESDSQTRRLFGLLQAEKENQLRRVSELQDKVLKFTKESAGADTLILDPFAHTMVAIDPRLSALHQELIRTQVDRDVSEAQLRWKEGNAGPNSIARAVIEYEISQNPTVQRLERRISASQQTLKQFNLGSPVYRELQTEIAAFKQNLEKLRGQLRIELPRLKREEITTSRQLEVAALKQRLSELVSREKGLLDRLKAARKELESKTGVRLDAEFARAELARAKSVAEKIEDRMFWLGVELRPAGRPERVQTLQKADVPVTASVTPYNRMALVGMIAFAFPFGVGVLWECLIVRRIYRPEQLASETRIPLVGEVADRPLRPLVALPWVSRRYERQRTVYEESIASLCTALAVYPQIKDLKVLLVASAVSGEGKSSLACQLAYNWAVEAGERVLVIDADLRHPSLQDLFDVESEPGLSDVLSGECEAEAAITDWSNELKIIPAGTSTDRQHRLFSNGAFPRLIEAMREKFDRIIIDPPPVLSAGETIKVANSCDGFIYCARKDVSRIAQVQLAYERLAKVGVQSVGAVFIGTPSDSYVSYYGRC